MTVRDRIEAALGLAVEQGAAPGIVAAAVTVDGVVHAASAGTRGLEDPTPMSDDTVFWIASLTKALTSAAVLGLIEQGRLSLDEPVGEWLPALAAPRVLTGFDADGRPLTRPARKPITVRHLLTHTSGLAYQFFSADLLRHQAAVGAEAGFDAGAPDVPLVFEPGEGWQYGLGLDWAGRLVEAVAGRPFAACLEEQVLGPLGMTDTAFFPGAAMSARKAAVHARLPDGGLAAMPFAMPSEPYFGMGGGGLHSTVGDYLRFLRCVLGGGELEGRRILRPETVALMTSDQAGGLDAGVLKSSQAHMSNDFEPLPGVTKRHGCGFLINAEPGPEGRATGSVAWAGLANCYYWADPRSGVAGVFFSQVLPFADPRLLEAFAAFERAVYAA